MSSTRASERLVRSVGSNLHSLSLFGPLIVLIAVSLSGCGDKPPQPAAAAAPPVTVAQPVKRTVTDWDEFTGRFEAIEEVQVRARVGGFVTSVEFKDGDMVHAGDLLYIIDSRPFEAVATQADGQLADARAKTELAKRELDRGLNLVEDQCRLRTGRRPAPPGLAGGARRRDHRRGCAQGRPAQRRVHPCGGADHGPRQPPSRQRRQSRAGQRQWRARPCLPPSSRSIRSTSISTWTRRPI